MEKKIKELSMAKGETVIERLQREKAERLKKRQAQIRYMLKLWGGRSSKKILKESFYC